MHLSAACSDQASSRATTEAAAPAAKSAERRKPAKKSQVRMPNPNATTVWKALAFFLPRNIEGFQPRAVLEGHDLDVGGEEPVFMAKRAYGNPDGVSLELELLDAASCPRLRELVLRTRELARDNPEAVMRAIKVQGQRAQAQWFASNKTARTSVLVGDRFIVHAVVKPADSAALSIAVAEQLDYAALQQLPPLAASPSPVAAKPETTSSIAAASDDTPPEDHP